MKTFYAIVVFFLVALVYSHLIQEFAPSTSTTGYASGDRAEVYELDYSDPHTFHETCRVRHPVVILDPPAYPSAVPTRQECLRQFPQHNLYMKHRQDYPQDVEGIPVQFDTAMQGVFSTTTNALHADPYFTENNGKFLRETGLDRMLAEEGDAALAPPMTAYRAYDWMTGSSGGATPLRYHTYSRRYWRVIEGPSVQIKLIPWTYTHQLREHRDYDAYEFVSEADVWGDTAYADHRGVVDVELHCGQMLYLPPYWWYSVRYPSAGTVIVEHTYATYMNRLANLGDLGRHWLQRHVSHTTVPMLPILTRGFSSSSTSSTSTTPPPSVGAMTETETETKTKTNIDEPDGPASTSVSAGASASTSASASAVEPLDIPV